MTSRIDLKRGFLAALTAVTVAFALVLVAGGSSASAIHVNPVFVEGNPTCVDYTGQGGTEFKLEGGDLVDGVHTDGVLIVTLDIYQSANGTEFNWSTNFGVDVVVVKGGPVANVYLYNPIETADTGLHSPLNPNNDMWYGLSHISFCYFEENATTTTTLAPTTTTTIEDEVSPTSIVSTTTTIVSTTVEVSADTLPFTGFENGTSGLLALVLVATGALALVGTRVFRRETDE